MNIIYKTNIKPLAKDIIAVYLSAGLSRPTDEERIARIYEGSNVVMTAWDGDQLIGVCRSISDGAWVCYLSDLAVRKEYHSAGVGRKLIDLTREAIGEEVMLLLLSVPEAMGYYPKIGMEELPGAFVFRRKR